VKGASIEASPDVRSMRSVRTKSGWRNTQRSRKWATRESALTTIGRTTSRVRLPTMLPDELIQAALNDQFPCRELQIRQLATLCNVCPYPAVAACPCPHRLQHALPSPSTLVLYGPQATGKSSVAKSLFKAQKLQHTIVRCRECITGRHLLERTVASCLDALETFNGEDIDRAAFARTDSTSTLAVHLQRLFERRSKFILAFDGIDKQREAPPTLLPALARFGEIVRPAHGFAVERLTYRLRYQISLSSSSFPNPVHASSTQPAFPTSTSLPILAISPSVYSPLLALRRQSSLMVWIQT